MGFFPRVSIIGLVFVVLAVSSTFADDYALDFDGINDYVDCGNAANMDNMQSITMSAWIFPEGWGANMAGRIISKRNHPINSYELQLEGTSGNNRVIATFYGENQIAFLPSTNNSISLGDWYHVAATSDGFQQKIYINGEEKGSLNVTTGKIRDTDATLWLGQITTAYVDRAFDGKIDDVMIFDRALSAGEIGDLYECGGFEYDPNLVGYWKFDEGSEQTAYDYSIYENDGQLGSGPEADASDPIWVTEVPPVAQYIVDDNGPNDLGPGDPNISDPCENGRIDHPYDSIQEAIDSITECRSQIYVMDGTYSGEGNYNIDPNGKIVTIISESGPKYSVIDCNQLGRGFIFDSGESYRTIISGLTITNGYSSRNGGGIYCYQSSPTIYDCVLKDNYADWSGGGIFLESASDAWIERCTIINNESVGGGGGAYVYDSMPLLLNCVIADNIGKWSGGISSEKDSSWPWISNCTIADNNATSGAGGIESYDGGNCILENSIVWGNTGVQISEGSGIIDVNYCDIQTEDANVWGNDANNLDADPLFADANNHDYHLKSSGGRWFSRFITNGDFNDDGEINLYDFDMFADTWLYSGVDIMTDLSGDDHVNFTDLAMFNLNWHKPGVNQSGWISSDAESSPCIDSGALDAPYLYEPDPNGSRANMGAYANTEQASKSSQ